jgi:hypothetical protein
MEKASDPDPAGICQRPGGEEIAGEEDFRGIKENFDKGSVISRVEEDSQELSRVEVLAARSWT